MKTHKVTFVLLIIGGLGLGLEALGLNLGQYLSNGWAITFYSLIGLSALYEAFMHKKLCSDCSSSKGATT